MLALGLRLTTEAVARELLDAFLGTDVDEAERGEIAKLDGR